MGKATAWLPTVAFVLAIAAIALFGWTWWRRTRAAENGHGCAGSSCGCGTAPTTPAAVDVSVHSRP